METDSVLQEKQKVKLNKKKKVMDFVFLNLVTGELE